MKKHVVTYNDLNDSIIVRIWMLKIIYFSNCWLFKMKKKVLNHRDQQQSFSKYSKKKSLKKKFNSNQSWRKTLDKIKINSIFVQKKNRVIKNFILKIKEVAKTKKKTVSIMTTKDKTYEYCNNKNLFVQYFHQVKKRWNFCKKFIIDFKIMFTKYHDFLNVFFKEKIDELISHKKYDYWIKLIKNASTHAFLYYMSNNELLLIKRYLKKNLKKKFIVFSSINIVRFAYFVC